MIRIEWDIIDIIIVNILIILETDCILLATVSKGRSFWG